MQRCVARGQPQTHVQRIPADPGAAGLKIAMQSYPSGGAEPMKEIQWHQQDHELACWSSASMIHYGRSQKEVPQRL